jgi:16S rRNA processing protein RimM
VPQDWVWLARIRRPQGRKGEVFADLLTDFPEKFAERRRLWLLAEPATAKPDPMSGHTAQLLKSRSSAEPSSAKAGLVSGHAALLLKSRSATEPSSAKPGPVSGHDFSRAANAAKSNRALAPAGSSPDVIAPREVELAHHWPHKGGIVLHFGGIDSISAAETLKGLIVAIPRSERAALAEDEVYTGDLIGCALIDLAGAEPVTVGEIEKVDRTAGPVSLLMVRGPAGEVLIPFAKSFLRKIDLEARRVEMALPEGLVNLNAPGENPRAEGVDKSGS